MSDRDKPYLSICIASYNYAQYLERGLNAIKRQHFKDFEIIYLDDASTDNSAEIICGFIKDNPDMRISFKRHSENKGLTYTKTELLKLATGKYIMLCDADDWMADNCLEILVARAKTSDADRIISQVFDVDINGRVLQIQDFSKNPSKWLWNLHHGCLYKKTIIDKCNIRLLLYPDDVYLTTICNQYCKKVEWISEPLYYWLVHNESAGRKKKKDVVKILEDFHNIIHFVNQVKEIIQEEQDKEEINLLLIKLYYLQLFHELKRCNLREKMQMYYRLKCEMKSNYPSFLNNPFLKIRGQRPARNYAMNIMRLGCFLEKIHMMWLGLIVYHLLCKWVIFDQ